tara:strand:- start:769 stop:1002 length:234 start_codon:yes stop_codon:yes gene_type:complete
MSAVKDMLRALGKINTEAKKAIKRLQAQRQEWDYERAALLSEIKSLQKRLRLCGKDNIELRKRHEKNNRESIGRILK